MRFTGTWFVVMVLVVSLAGAGPEETENTTTLPTTVQQGIAWLDGHPNPDGSWGSFLPFVETASTLETLGALAPDSGSIAAGAAWLAGRTAANHDDLARQTLALDAVEGFTDEARNLALQILGARNPVEFDTGLPNWPEGGWGVAPGYETDALTTGLSLLALDTTGFNGGFSASNQTVAAGATNLHVWEIPPDATKARIQITVSGAQIRLCMTEGAPPPFCSSFFPLLGGPFLIVFPDSGLPFTPGTNYIVIESTGPAATYSLTASYETPILDTRSLAEPLDYLRQAQNVDGGWGLQRGLPTELYTTQHVLLSLMAFNAYELDSEIAAGIAYLKSQQLVDGSFGFAGSGMPYVTALGALDLVRSEGCIFGTETQDAVNALMTQQLPDGSWDTEPYDTALAALALAEFGDDLDGDGVRSDGDCSGSASDNPCTMGATANCDDNCRELANASQANVDGDPLGDACDCDNGNSLVWEQPGEAAIALSWIRALGRTDVNWTLAGAPGGAGALFYDTLRSSSASDFVGAAICLESDDTDTIASDFDLPGPGALHFYLVRVENDCPGAGLLGFDSGNMPRAGRTCP